MTAVYYRYNSMISAEDSYSSGLTIIDQNNLMSLTRIEDPPLMDYIKCFFKLSLPKVIETDMLFVGYGNQWSRIVDDEEVECPKEMIMLLYTFWKRSVRGLSEDTTVIGRV